MRTSLCLQAANIGLAAAVRETLRFFTSVAQCVEVFIVSINISVSYIGMIFGLVRVHELEHVKRVHIFLSAQIDLHDVVWIKVTILRALAHNTVVKAISPRTAW